MIKKESRKILILGDVHGCFEEFIALLNKVDYSAKTHRLILVGDIINRGPDSFKMLKWVKEHKIEMVRGNHEQDFLRGVKQNLVLKPIFAKLKEDLKPDLDFWLEWLEALPFYIEEENFLVVHAGLVPGEHPRDSDPHLLMNIRTWDGKGKDIQNEIYPAWYSFYTGKKSVIYGHWSKQGLNIGSNRIGLDSGCIYGYQLSGVLLPEKKIIQVPALQSYSSFKK